MAGDPKKGASRRLGSLAGDVGDAGPSLGSLRMATGRLLGDEAGGAKAPIAAREPRQVKFMPMAPVRRRKTEPVSGAVGVVEDADLKHVVHVAQPQQRGGERSGRRGNASAPAAAQQAQQVTFGGRTPAAAAPRSAVAASAAASSPAVKSSASAPAAVSKPRLKKAAVKVVRRDDDGGAALDEMADDMGVLSEGGGALDYEVYYPTMLPLLPPEQERASMLAAGSAPATTAQEDDVGSVADILGLSAGAEPADHERLVLFQLPSLLPAPPPSVRPHAAVKAEHGGRQLQKNRSDSLGSSPTERAASADQLPSGKVGRLLVFESGAVKLQMGDVLLDVAPGNPSAVRQEVAAVTCPTEESGGAHSAAEGTFLQLGKLEGRLVCSPDLDQLLSDSPVPDWERAPMTSAMQGATDTADAMEDPMDVDALPIQKTAPRVKAGSSHDSSASLEARRGRRRMVVSDDEDR